MSDFSVTENAADRIHYLLSQEPNGQALMLRIAITGGGCSGYQYNFTFDDQVLSDDKVFQTKDAKVVVDETSLELLQGSVLDYVEDLTASQFVITNPQASSKCGCGNSFSV